MNAKELGTAFWDWADKRRITQRIVLLVTVWMTYKAFLWASQFGFTTDKNGADAGLIIAAVTAPIAALQGYVFKLYAENREV